MDITGDAGRNTAFRTGGFVGCVYFSGDVRNCYVDGGTVTGDDEIGGFAGSFRTSLLPMPYLENCYADVDVDGEDWVGGFTGVVNSNTHGLHNSYALGDVQGNQYVGGFVGAITNGSEITNCYSIGDVTGNSDVSGFGDFSHIDLPSISKDEEIEGKSIEGDENVENCYWNTETSDMDTSELGEGKTTEEMTGEDALNNIHGFDFEEIWKTVEEDNEKANEDGYPILQGISREVQFKAQGIYEEEYTLTVTIEGEGMTDPSEGTQTYEKGTKVEVEATPDEGYVFDEWTGDYENDEKEIDVVMDEHKEITAHFKEVVEEYDILYIIEDEEGDPIEGATVEINDMEEMTDEDGEAVFEDLEPDTYDWEVTHDDYETEDGEVEIVDQDETVTVIMEEDEDTPGFTSMILILGIIIAVGIYHKKKQ